MVWQGKLPCQTTYPGAGLNVFRADLGATSILDIFTQAMFFNLVRKESAKKKQKPAATDDEKSLRPAASLKGKH